MNSHSPTPSRWQTVTVSYADPSNANDNNAVQDSQGNDVASLSSTVVTNNSTVEIVQFGSDIDGVPSSYSGSAVSLSDDGTVLAIGAYQDDDSGNDAGHTRIYAWNGTAWVQRGNDIDADKAEDHSGHSVSLSSDGSVVAIGANQADGNGEDSGLTRIYAWNGTAWVQRGSDIDGEAAGDLSGVSVSLSSDGNTIAIGARSNDNGNGANSGHTRIYDWNGTAWVQRGTDIDGEAINDGSGRYVSLSSDGDIVAIGAIGNNGTSGHTRIYAWNGTAWVQRGNDIDAEAAADWSGVSVSLSNDGTIAAIGASLNDGNGDSSGHTRIYAWNGTAWVQRGNDIDGEAAGDTSGSSVSLSGDGKTVAIGATGNDGNGSFSGHTRLYQWNGTDWVQIGTDIDGEDRADFSGWAVSLSNDGKFVAIGANHNDDAGSTAGHVRVFKISDTTAPTFSSAATNAEGTKDVA